MRSAGRGRGLALPLIAAVLAAAPAAEAEAQAQTHTLRSGALEARVTSEPFAIQFVDSSDGDTLRTVGAGSQPGDPRAAYGPLGYSFDLRIPVLGNAYFGYYRAVEVPTVWFHARRVAAARMDGGSLVLDVETNDPLGHRLEVTLSPTAEGAITLSSRLAHGPLAGQATVSGAAFEAADGERYLGFGERSNAVDQTGKLVYSWAEEGPFGGGDYEELLRGLIPDFTFPNGPTASNLPIPWLVSSRGLGFLVDQPERNTFHLLDERPGAWRAEAEANFLRVTVFAGPKPADVLRRYSAYAGRQPRPSAWLFGPWVQFRDKWPESFRFLDVPATVAQTYTHYLPCGAHVGREAQERETVERYHSLGYKVTTYFNSHVCLDYGRVYDEAARNGWLVKNGAGLPYLISNPFTAERVAGLIDFTAPGAKEFYARLLDEAIDIGYDGWMEDFGEYAPFDAVFADGRRGRELHNLYPVLYHGASTEHTARRGGDFAVFVRSGYHGIQRHARVVWGGDPTEDWSCSDGLCAAVHQLLSTGLSGIAYQGSDIGGFHAIVNDRTSDELNARWLEVGAVSGVMRTQANGYSLTEPVSRRSQVWSPKVLPIWRRYAKLRTQLYPYIASASLRYQRDGLPIARQLALVFPDDPRAARSQSEFMFGPSLLAAPVLERGATTRRLYLPAGRWVDLWRSLTYQGRRGSLRLGAAPTLEGGREITVPAPLEELPLFARAGTILPLLPADVDTLANLGTQQDLVHLGDRRRRLTLIAFPRGRSAAELGPGARARSIARRRSWTLRIRSERRRRYRLQASMATLARPFRPCRVRLRGRRLQRRLWRYEPAARVLRARFRLRSGSLTVLACRRRFG